MEPQHTQAFGTELLMQNANLIAKDLYEATERIKQLERLVTDLRRDVDSQKFFMDRLLDEHE